MKKTTKYERLLSMIIPRVNSDFIKRILGADNFCFVLIRKCNYKLIMIQSFQAVSIVVPNFDLLKTNPSPSIFPSGKLNLLQTEIEKKAINKSFPEC